MKFVTKLTFFLGVLLSVPGLILMAVGLKINPDKESSKKIEALLERATQALKIELSNT